MQSLKIDTIGQEPEEKLFYWIYGNNYEELLSGMPAQDVEVLDILFKLGFPKDERGTYCYKDMIVQAIHHLDGFDVRHDPISEDELLKQMQSKYSQFYFDIARNDLDIGIKTFHTYINHALSSVDYACVDPSVLSEIYGDFSEEADYGKHAFVIAKNIYGRTNADKMSNTQASAVQYVKTAISSEN